MSLFLVLAVVVTLALTAWADPVAAATWPDRCEESSLAVDDPEYPQDQRILICLPDRSNGHLVVYAHGYVRPQKPLELPGEDLEISEIRKTIGILLDLGFAFASTSYHKNGYAVEQAEQDLQDLIEHVTTRESDLVRVWVVGASEGGLVATTMVERHPSLVDGGLAMCGPLAGPLHQIRYLADVRLVFDHLFPEVFPFGVADTPTTAWESWESDDGHRARIVDAVEADPEVTGELLEVTQMSCPVEQRSDCIKHVLAYSIFSLHDLITTAGGWPYDNRGTAYSGSSDDAALNASVERLTGDWTARRYLGRHYRPRGQLRRHLVTLHTSGDHGVPVWHERIYEQRVKAAGRTSRLTQIEIDRAGHCTFQADEVVGALALLIVREDGDVPLDMIEYLGKLISLEHLTDEAREALRAMRDRIDGSIGAAIDAAVDRVDEVDVGDIAADGLDWGGDWIEAGTDRGDDVADSAEGIVDNAKDAAKDAVEKVKKLF